MSDGKLLEKNKTYKVATIEFIAAGGDGYEMFKKGANLTYYGGDVEAFAEYIKTNPVIKSKADGRVKLFSPENKPKPNDILYSDENGNIPETAPKTGESDNYAIILIFVCTAVMSVCICKRKNKNCS